MPKHRKSRLGCKECKERKVKCDEARPICIRCRSAGRPCSYRTLVTNLPTPTSQASSLSSTTPVPSPHPGVSPGHHSHSTAASHQASPAPTPHDASTLLDPRKLPESYFSERFSLFHFDLLLHFRGPLMNSILASQPELDGPLRLIYREALRAPYLMDQVLAFATAHKSTTTRDDESRQFYLKESTRLQTRAIRQLRLCSVQVTEENVMPLFCFSLLLGQQTLFDAFSAATSIPTVLDNLVQCLTLHHGIRDIVSASIGKFQVLLQKHLPHNPVYSSSNVTDLVSGTDCDDLLERLQNSEIGQETKAIYVEAVKILQYLYDSVRSDSSRKYYVIQEWPVRVSKEYVSLLQQRRPEALVILSYYAVLLHWARDYWAVGDSGSFLIRAIASHLGAYWADWLAWPNQKLDKTSPGESLKRTT